MYCFFVSLHHVLKPSLYPMVFLASKFLHVGKLQKPIGHVAVKKLVYIYVCLYICAHTVICMLIYATIMILVV